MKVVLVPPETLPGHDAGDVPGPLTARQQFFADALREPHASRDRLALLRSTQLDPQPHPSAAAGSPQPGSRPQTRGEDEFDDFFGIVRETAAGPGSFASSLFAGYRAALEEAESVGTRLSCAEWAELCSAFQAVLCFPDESVDVLRPVLGEPPLMGSHVDCERRWVVGHQVFLVLIQALVVTLNAYDGARRRGDLDLAGRALVCAARVMAGSGASLVFASEFAPGQYAARVRPSMQEPFVSAGFSGLLSSDHRFLVRQLGALKGGFDDLPPRLAGARDAFASAMARTYDAHKYVCARFGGRDGVSLRMSDRSAFTAVDVIHGLKLARTHLVGSS